VIPWLEEYLEHFRPQLPNAARDRHVFLSQYGHPLTPPILLTRLRVHVYRYTGKRFYTHLLRSIFMSHHMTAGVDLNSIAYAMNDMPLTTLNNYNELMADKHRPIIADANRAALTNGHKPLTPPTIPLPPKRSKPIDPDQLALI
jgi:site-specific recombinase XerD